MIMDEYIAARVVTGGRPRLVIYHPARLERERSVTRCAIGFRLSGDDLVLTGKSGEEIARYRRLLSKMEERDRLEGIRHVDVLVIGSGGQIVSGATLAAENNELAEVV